MSIAFYVGCGLDVIPIIMKKDIKIFVYIDAGPSFDPSTLYPSAAREFKFSQKLDTVMARIGFEKQDNGIYFNMETSQVVCYFHNTVFPTINDNISCFMPHCDTLIVAGHNPIIPKTDFMFPNVKRLIVNLHTCYDVPEDEYYHDREMYSSIFEYYAHRPIDIECIREKEPCDESDMVTPQTAEKYDIVTMRMTLVEFEKRKRTMVKEIQQQNDMCCSLQTKVKTLVSSYTSVYRVIQTVLPLLENEPMLWFFMNYVVVPGGKLSSCYHIVTNKNIYRIHELGERRPVYTFSEPLPNKYMTFLDKVMTDSMSTWQITSVMSVGVCQLNRNLESIIRIVPGSYQNGSWKQLDGFFGIYFHEPTMELSELPPLKLIK